MDYQNRINTIRKYMDTTGADLFITTPDANTEYLTGIPRYGSGHTRERQHSIEYSCLTVTENSLKAFMPHLKTLIAKAKLGNTETNVDFVPFPDGDTEGEALINELSAMGLKGKTAGVTNDVPAAFILLLQNRLNMNVINLNQAIYDMRSIKDPDEIKIMKEAVEITDKVYNALIDAIIPGASVRELEHYIDTLIERFGGSQSSFEGELNVHGPKAGHFVGFSHDTIEKGYVLGLDFGLMYKGYCTDFGRTVFIGEPSQEHIKIYNTVKAAHHLSISLMDHYHNGEEIDCAARDAIENAGYGKSFIHKLGHSIGMDVHERPFLAKGENKNLENNMIFAVEPSIYIPKSCFIRLEDQVIVSPDGGIIMSKISHDIKVIG